MSERDSYDTIKFAGQMFVEIAGVIQALGDVAVYVEQNPDEFNDPQAFMEILLELANNFAAGAIDGAFELPDIIQFVDPDSLDEYAEMVTSIPDN